MYFDLFWVTNAQQACFFFSRYMCAYGAYHEMMENVRIVSCAPSKCMTVELLTCFFFLGYLVNSTWGFTPTNACEQHTGEIWFWIMLSHKGLHYLLRTLNIVLLLWKFQYQTLALKKRRLCMLIAKMSCDTRMLLSWSNVTISTLWLW